MGSWSLRKDTCLHDFTIQTEAANADIEAAASYPEDLAKMMNKGGYIKKQMFNVNETACYWKKMPFRNFIARKEKSMSLQCFKGWLSC